MLQLIIAAKQKSAQYRLTSGRYHQN